jgi:tetratricopeptide (TPR) repeat protein
MPEATSRVHAERSQGAGLGVWTVLALAALTAVAFEPVRHLGFVAYDDPKYVIANPHVMAGLTWAGLRWAFTTVYGPYWHPLTLVSHMADVEAFGAWAAGHHAVNLALHVANTLLVFAALRTMTGAPGRSAVVAALFAVHPLHVESVAWITERLDVLSTLFLLLTLLAYVRYVRRPSATRFALVLLCYAFGLMSKPTLVTVPVVLVLLDVWPLSRGLRLLEKVPLAAMAIAGSAMTVVFEVRHGSVSGVDVLPVGERVANAFVWYVTYLVRTFWPVGLSPFYPYPARMPPVWAIGGAATLVIGVSVLALRARTTRPSFFLGWSWFVVTLLPMIGLVQAADQATADRFTYVPLIGLFVAIVWGVAEITTRVPARRVVAPVLTAVVVGACVVLTRAQVRVWTDTTTLWTQAIAVTHDNHRAHAALGEALTGQGRAEEGAAHLREAIRLAPRIATYHNALGMAYEQLKRIPDATVAYRDALRLDPDSPQARTNYGRAMAAAGDLDEAVAQHRRALALDWDLPEAHVNLASALLRQRQIDEARRHVREALRLNPGLAQAHAVHGAILQLQNDDEAAIAEYEAALAIDPALAQVRSNLGGALLKRGDTARAADAFVEALRLDPSLGDAHNGLGVALTRQDRGDEAIAHYREAVRLKPDSISPHSNLGVALAARGDVAGAIREFEAVLRLDPANPQARAALQFLKTGGKGRN